MNFINSPNLPDKPVINVIADGRISDETYRGLKAFGMEIIKTERHEAVYPAISFHPDIMLHHLGGKYMVYAPNTHKKLLDRLTALGMELIQGQTGLSSKYPGNIAYNVARIGMLAFHNLKYTDPILRSELEKRNVELIHVNQGYAKCSISIVDAGSIITSDKGIARMAEKKGLDVLLLDEDEDILLPGLGKGLIGGATGLIDKSKWLIVGNIEHIKSAKKIIDFLEEKGIKVVSTSKEQVKDIGSILPLDFE